MESKIPQLTPAEIAQIGRHETLNTKSEHYSLRVKGIRALFILLYNKAGRSDKIIYLRKTSILADLCVFLLLNVHLV